MPVDAGDFRLLDRRVADIITRRFHEHSPYLRGLVSYIGFKQIGIPYQRSARTIGESKFSYFSYFGLAWDAITSFSRVPLKIVSGLGMIMACFAFLGIIFYLTMFVVYGIPVQGFPTIVLLLLLLFGIQLLSLGIFGEYISRIFEEVKDRPRTIVDQHCGFKDPPIES